MYLRDFAVGSKKLNYGNISFSELPLPMGREVICIDESFVYSMRKNRLLTKETAKVFVEAWAEPGIENYKILLNVAWVCLSFPYEEYIASSIEEKLEHLIEFSERALKYVGSQCNWDMKTIEKIIEEVKQDPLPDYTFKKKKSSPDRKHKADIVYRYTPHSFEIDVVIYDRKSNELGRKTVLTAKPVSDAIGYYCKEFFWTSNDQIEITPGVHWKNKLVCNIADIVN